MSTEIEPIDDPTNDEVEKILAYQERWNESILSLPREATISRALATFIGVYIDADGTVDPPQDPFNTEVFGAIVALERRVIAIEKRLDEAGI